MYKATILICLLSLSSCKADYETYLDTDNRFKQLESNPEVFIVVKPGKGIYYKIIHFTKGWHINNGYTLDFDIEEGYHISDGQGYAGYDFDHTFPSLDKAIKAAESAGYSYVHQLGEEYQFQSGSLYSTRPFRKLNKQ